jgi:tetratricopeptide (TPR) repeat protein
MVNVSGFELFLEGRIEEAITAYSHEFKAKPSPLTLANRALARLSLGDHAGALADYRAAEEMQVREGGERGDAYSKRIGLVYWLMGLEEEALRVWEDVVDALSSGGIAFTDAAGGVQSGLLVWFSSAVRKDQAAHRKAITFLSKLSKKSSSKNWPGPIANYVLGSIDYTTLMQAAQQQSTLALRRGCQAVFYAAVDASAHGDLVRMVQLQKMAIEYGEEAALEIEYFLAGHEFKRQVIAT